MTHAPLTNWDERPLSDVIAHILRSYHQPLRAILLSLASSTQRTIEAFYGREPKDLKRLSELLASFSEDVESHMKKEEEVLFPLIASGAGPTAFHAVQAMSLEHEDATLVLNKIRTITESIHPPTLTQPAWEVFQQGLKDLDHSLREHMKLENDILFPRALHGDG